jgi:hypothetical protein
MTTGNNDFGALGRKASCDHLSHVVAACGTENDGDFVFERVHLFLR